MTAAEVEKQKNIGDLLHFEIFTRNQTQTMDSAAQSLAHGAPTLRMRRLSIALFTVLNLKKHKKNTD